MSDDLEQLLAKADRSAPPVRSDLGASVRRVVARRRRARRIAVASTAVILVSGIISLTLISRSHQSSAPVVAEHVDVEAIRKEIADLEREAKLHERIALAIEKALETDAKQGDFRLELSQPNALMELNQRRQVAAQLMLNHAEQLASDPEKKQEATASFRKLVALFPDTLASRAASDRLSTPGT